MSSFFGSACREGRVSAQEGWLSLVLWDPPRLLGVLQNWTPATSGVCTAQKKCT